MKIVHFLWALESGGSENLAVDLANHQSQDHEVFLIVGNTAVDPVVAKRLVPAVRLIVVGRPAGSRNPYWIARLVMLVNNIRADVIHSHSHDLGLLGRLVVAPKILTVHTVNIDLSKSRWSYRQICCISEAVLQDVSKRHPALRVCKVDNGIVTSKVKTVSGRDGNPVLNGVQVSRLVHDTKGQDLLIRALASLNTDHQKILMTIDFIGDGPSLGYLSKLANELGVSEYCKFLGALDRDEVYSRLCNYDLLIQPSRSEGFGLSVAEGMAAGIPVVVSDIEGPMELIRNGKYGYHFTCGDVADLSKCLERVAEDVRSGSVTDKTHAARQFVLENYSLSRMAGEYLRVYVGVTNA